MLSVRGVHRSYGSVRALVGVDLEVEAGETCCLIGPNGAGKTTLVSIVAGLRRPDRGSVTVGGIDATKDPHRTRAMMGIAPQELGIYPTVRVRDNLSLFAALNGLRRREAAARIDEVADILDLTRLLDRLAKDLSGGEKRRVHTAVAMIHRPRLLMLDEPTSGVDVATRMKLLSAVAALARDEGTAICYSTHYLPEVETLGATVAIIESGRIIARGAASELVARFGESAVEFRFEGPAPDVIVAGRRVEVTGDILRLYSEDPALETASILTRLGADIERLRGIEIVSSGLESVFLSLTGRRYQEEGPRAVHDESLPGETGVVADVVAP